MNTNDTDGHFRGGEPPIVPRSDGFVPGGEPPGSEPPAWRMLLLPFFGLAVFGLVLSVVSHLAALLRLPQPLGGYAWGLHVGIFVVWLPAVLVANSLAKDFKRNEIWKAALRGCPPWMRWMTYGIFAYAIANFVLFIVIEAGTGQAAVKGKAADKKTPPAVVAGFSGHWMAFYGVAAAILYSGFAVSKLDSVRRCPNGHPVSASAEFCEACGARIVVRG